MSNSENVTAITLDNGVKLTTDQVQVLEDGIKEMVNSMYLKQAQTDHQKEISKRIKEELDGAIPPATFRKLATIAYKDNAKKLNDETTEVLDLAESLGYYSHNPED